MKAKEKAWLAGVLDKGSYIGVTNTHVLQLKIQTTNFKLVRRVTQICGFGNYFALPGKRNNKYYILYFSPLEAESVLKDVRPYLKVKNKHADIALRLRSMSGENKTQKTIAKRETCRRQIAKMATRGPKSSLLI